MRAVPLLAALGALVVFWRLSSRMLGAPGTILAVAMFAISEPLIYYASETKQYSVDVLVAVTLWWTFTAIKARLDDDRPAAWALVAILGAAAIWISHPAIFVLGGVSIPAVWHSLRRNARRSLVLRTAACAIWGVSFLALYVLFLRVASVKVYAAYWRGAEAPLLPRGVDDLTRYIDFVTMLGALPLSRRVFQLVLLGALVGVVALWRRRQRQLAWFAGAFALVWVASALAKYPVTERLWLFLAPAVIVLVAAGAEDIWDRTRQTLPVLGPIFACLLLAHPALTAAHAALRPRGREEIRPLLEHARAHYREGDVLYLYRMAEPAALYYARRGLSFPGAIMLGLKPASRYQGEADVEKLRGRPRVWVLFSHMIKGFDGLDEEKLFLHALDRAGVRQDAIRQTGAALYLYDVSRAP